MPRKLNPKCTLCAKRPDGRPPKKNLSQRAAIAARFKVLCLDAGLKVPDVARTLQVTERTVYAWFSGKTAVPYSAYRLLRILNRFELPGWPGWHMHSGKLWSPEGFGFDPTDGAWWALLVRQARSFRILYARGSREAMGAAGRPEPDAASGRAASGGPAAPGQAGEAAGRRAAPPNLFLKHFRTRNYQIGVQPHSDAMHSIADGQSPLTYKGEQ